MTWRRLLLVTVACLLLGCSSQSPDATPAAEDTTGLTAILSGGLDEGSQGPAALRDTAWRLLTIDRGPGPEDVAALSSSLGFGLDDVAGKTCNSYGARVKAATADRITTEGFFSTQMGCGGPEGDVDRLVQEVLAGGAMWERQGARLTLGRGDVRLVFALQPE